MPGRVSVVVGLPPGSRHELGALAFAAALRRRGVGVLYLGSDVTVDGWLDAVARTRARAAVIGVVTADDRASAALVVAELLAHDVPLVAVGGAAARSAEAGRVGRGASVRTAWSRRRRPSPRSSAGDAADQRAGTGSSPPPRPTTRSHSRRRSAAVSRVDGTRSNGRGAAVEEQAPVDPARGSGWVASHSDRVDPLLRRAQQRSHDPVEAGQRLGEARRVGPARVHGGERDDAAGSGVTTRARGRPGPASRVRTPWARRRRRTGSRGRRAAAAACTCRPT